MNKQTSILTDIELNAVAGGSAITDMAAAGVKAATKRFSFGSGSNKPGNEGRCPPNHNGVR
jgi:hypothetical protein